MQIVARLSSIISAFAVLLVGFGVLTYLKVPVGDFGDWLEGLAAFFWLVTIITVPWNIHFKAKAVLADALTTSERGLTLNERQVAYVRRLARVSLWLAIGLHLGSAGVLFWLAKIGVCRIGYVASALALLLTGLRPAASAYHYISLRLHAIGEGWKYPREDVVELRGRVDAMEAGFKRMDLEFNADRPESLLSQERAHAALAQKGMATLEAELAALRATNEVAHERLSQEARSAISQLSTDGQFLEHVREILRFFKSA